MITMQDIATKLGVSRATVSYALGDSWSKKGVSPVTREKVLEAVEKLQYRRNYIATSLRKQKTMTVGVLIPVLTGDMYGKMVHGVECTLGDKYTLLLGVSGYEAKKERKILESFASRQVDGLIIAGCGEEENRDILNRICHTNPCVVQVDRFYEDIPSDVVEADNFSLGLAATEHLVKLGHREIAFIRSPHDTSATVNRANGYEEAIRRVGLKSHLFPAEACEIEVSPDSQGYTQAKAALEKLSAKLTGFVVHDAGMAVGVLKAVEEAGLRCPEDISIITVRFVGDVRSEDYLLRINFTAFCWSVEEMGRQAGSFLLDRIENKVDTRRTIQISGRLLEGNSTIAIPSRVSSLSANGQKRVKDSERREVGV
jgi:LacI family transcriptional regulator